MSFEQEISENENRNKYESIKSEATFIKDRLAAWSSAFDALRASVTADKQAELDTKKTQFVTSLKNTLGL